MTPATHEERLRFVLDGQRHCDFYLGPIADPAGRSVLVAGCGAGTEMLWSLRRGAREVVGVDILPQDSTALEDAVRRFDLAPGARFSMRRLPIEEIPELGRSFDLVLSNNVFEHVARLDDALAACRRVLEPGSGRLAIFSAPLFYSSSGSHLEHEPWEHLWGNGAELRERILASGQAAARALADMQLERYFDGEITLNRLRFQDFVEGFARAGFVAHKLAILPDRSSHRLAEFAPRIRERFGDRLSALDLTIQGILAELGPGCAERNVALVPSLRRLATHAGSLASPELPPAARDLEADLGRERERANLLQIQLVEVLGLLDAVQSSPTFRLARRFSSGLKALGRWRRP